MKLILCPHVDDEVIGCWSVLSPKMPHDSPVIIAYMSRGMTDERTKEAYQLPHEFNAAVDIFNLVHLPEYLFSNSFSQVYAPDPHWEAHPDHKRIGAVAWAWCQDRHVSFYSYSTNMNVPYLRELLPAQQHAKRSALDRLFPSQADLWKFDHRYFLFEGISLWNPGV